MKVAVSIPDDIFAEADRLAEAVGESRSAFYAQALRDRLRKSHDIEITAAWNAALAEVDQEEDLPFVRKAASEIARHLKW
jgi:metal-responsive CopG/Arc/MetJ family transcriptional regulator